MSSPDNTEESKIRGMKDIIHGLEQINGYAELTQQTARLRATARQFPNNLRRTYGINTENLICVTAQVLDRKVNNEVHQAPVDTQVIYLGGRGDLYKDGFGEGDIDASLPASPEHKDLNNLVVSLNGEQISIYRAATKKEVKDGAVVYEYAAPDVVSPYVHTIVEPGNIVLYSLGSNDLQKSRYSLPLISLIVEEQEKRVAYTTRAMESVAAVLASAGMRDPRIRVRAFKPE